ncbi:fibronectin type III domain-containing protein [Butyrivibrio sp. MB2005]|uniref:fibronectin type III domain-containing protein n=1 Tax=Butyrivibrio sp. MB2005 TaxID=1280678 RepID=UPI00041794E2|nr:fibronectin type III domain-containing protein [Butyrivibrio sp. MB2005]
MKQKRKRFLGILLSLALVLGMIPGMSLTAYADDNPPYAQYNNTTTEITFDGKPWYLIDYDAYTVMLLAKECVGASKYNESGSFVEYSNNPTVKTAVDSWYNSKITSDAKTAVSGGGMFLLTTAQARTIYNANRNVLKCEKASGAQDNSWWLRSPGYNGIYAAFVYGGSGDVDGTGDSVTGTFGVRPALQLNLSSVIFESGSKTFLLKHSVTLTGGANATTSGGATSQTGLTGAMTTVTYTANTGYYFAEFTDITNNGITAKRTSSTVVTVSGTPTADAAITVPNAVEKTDPSSSGTISETSDNPQPEITENIDNKQKTTSLKKPKAGKKSFTLTWNKVTAKGIKGYEIQYSTNKSFKEDATKTVSINKTKTTSKTIKKLKSKTKYYVRIRTFTKKNGEKVYSKWSKTKNVKVK